MAISSGVLGTEDIRKLLIQQAIPSSIGVLFMSVNILIDTIFVGRWIGTLAIAAVTVVLPITFLVSSLGVAIGIGGSSVLSRALGSGNKEKALSTFGNQIIITFGLALLFVIAGIFFSKEIISLFGANGVIMSPTMTFFMPILYGVPFLALCMMGTNVIRAEGKAKFSMVAMIIPAFSNIILDIFLIRYMNMGIAGAAWATTISYFISFLFVLWFFLYKSDLKINWSHFRPKWDIIKEIISMGIVTFSRQGVVALLAIIMNHALYAYGGEHFIAVYGIVSRMLMFALFPVLGITQGFLPIAGYNYGAKNYHRVKETIQIAIKYAGLLAIFIFILVLIFAEPIVTVFSTDPLVIAETPGALRWVFAASPVIAIQLIGAAYFQAAGKAFSALTLTLSKQGFFLIPLVIILPKYFGIFGIWISFPIADVLSTILTGIYLKREMDTQLKETNDGIL